MVPIIIPICANGIARQLLIDMIQEKYERFKET